MRQGDKRDRIRTYEFLVSPEDVSADKLAQGADDFALDLREARFGGSVRIGTPPDECRDGQGPKTWIDGVIALERCRIDGELIFDAVDFNWTCRISKKDRDRKRLSHTEALDYFNDERNMSVKKGERFAVQARGIVTGDSITFHNCSGLNGADFANSEIGGDFSFFGKMRLHDSKPSLKITDAAIDPIGQTKIEGVRIAGDCKLIFDICDGPHIKAERAEIAGALIISGRPDGGVLSMDGHHYSAILKKAKLRRNAIDSSAKTNSEWNTYHANTMRSLPKIDLGNAVCSFIQHPPAAWPEAGRLLVAGFKYKRALEFGPLSPHPFASDSVVLDSVAERYVHYFMIILTVICTVLVNVLANEPTTMSGRVGFYEIIGILILLLVALGYCCIKHFSSPRRDRNLPMAIAWLNLQTVARNSFRRPGNTYHSLEPYSVAAQALREEGRWISANFVEERRLKVREMQLSHRINMFQKLLSKLMSGLNNYGFSLSRPIFLIGLLIALGAMLAHDAWQSGAISEKSYRTDAVQSPSAACPSAPPVTPSDFTSLLFAIDKIVPAVEFGQDDNWELCKTMGPWKSVPWTTYELIFAGLHLIGLSIVGLLLLALSTRLGLVFNRYNE